MFKTFRVRCDWPFNSRMHKNIHVDVCRKMMHKFFHNFSSEHRASAVKQILIKTKRMFPRSFMLPKWVLQDSSIHDRRRKRLSKEMMWKFAPERSKLTIPRDRDHFFGIVKPKSFNSRSDSEWSVNCVISSKNGSYNVDFFELLWWEVSLIIKISVF